MKTKRGIKFYSLVVFLLIIAVLSIQTKWFVNTALHKEQAIHDQVNTALCSAFKSIIQEESLGNEFNDCANLGNGKFEFLTNSEMDNLDTIIKNQLLRTDEIQVPFKVTLAAAAGTPPKRQSSANHEIAESNYGNQKALVNLDIPTRTDLLIEQINVDLILSFVFMFLIGTIFINAFKSLNAVPTIQFYTTNHVKTKTIFHIGRYTFDFKNQELTINDTARRITEKESQILRFLCDNKSQIVRRDKILTELWGEKDYFKGRSLDVFVARLRKYLSKDKKIRIESVYGVGFILHEK